MRLYLVRHGETDRNLRNMFYGWTDCDINETGVKQAKGLGSFFDGIHLDRIYASDLLRARHTAEIIRGERTIPLDTKEAFREQFFGDWEDVESTLVREQQRETYAYWLAHWDSDGIPGGEHFSEFYQRVIQGLEALIQENKGKEVLLVAHNGVLSIILCHLSGVGEKGYWRFFAAQGCYSSLLISGAKTTIERINCPTC